jgi:WD40 repeat protein
VYVFFFFPQPIKDNMININSIISLSNKLNFFKKTVLCLMCFFININFYSCETCKKDPKSNKTKLNNPVYAAFFSPDAKKIAVGCENGIFYEISNPSFKLLCSLKLGKSPVPSTLYARNTPYSISPCLDGKVFIVNTDSCKIQLEIKIPNFKIHHAAATTDLKYIAYSGNQNKIGVMQLSSGQKIYLTQSTPSHYFWLLNKLPHLLSGGGNGYVYRWNYETNNLIDSICLHRDEIYCISSDYNESQIITTSKDLHVCRFSIKENNIIESKKFFNYTPIVAMFRPKNTEEYAVCFTNGKVAVVNIKENKTNFIQAHNGRMVSLHYDNEGKYLLTGGLDGVVKLWDANTLKKLNEIKFQ